jgi:hypothetical protein
VKEVTGVGLMWATWLHIGCHHPFSANVTSMGDSHPRYICIRQGCGAEWQDIERIEVTFK